VKLKHLVRAAAAAASLALLAPADAAAQDYPTRPVRILIGFAPGGPTDILARLLADHLRTAMGQSFVVESKTGAAGIVAGQQLIAAPADGYTLYVVSFALISTAPALYSDMTYDPATAFAPISNLVLQPLALEVSPRLPIKTYQEFLAYAKANSGKLNHGSAGIGTQTHLVAELFRQRVGFQSEHIAYRGSGPYGQAMNQGELQWGFGSLNATLQFVQTGVVRVIAVSSKERWPSLPDVPTLTEQGLADAEWQNFFALVAAAGTPKAIIDRLYAEVARGWKAPQNAARLREIGFEPVTSTPEETTRYFAAERERWSAVVKANNIKAQ
jgi:tripartite-type tricarboxylate transporter receptor subunit TctC